MADTPDQNAAEAIGRTLDNQIAALNIERELLVNAPARIKEIDDTLAVLQAESDRVRSRRPVKVAAQPVDSATPVRVK